MGTDYGYSDLNFLIPSSWARPASKPVFADQGDSLPPGPPTSTTMNRLERPLVPGGGDEDFARARSRIARSDEACWRLSDEHNDGPWTVPDNYLKVNGLSAARDSVNGFSVTGMGY